MSRFILALMIALATGCAGRTTVAYSTSVPVATLVELDPGVYVVADHPEPVFFVDGLYWRYHGGRWYRSTWYGGGWVVATPPKVVLRIERPHRYVRYKPAPRDRVVVRDHRGWRRR